MLSTALHAMHALTTFMSISPDHTRALFAARRVLVHRSFSSLSLRARSRCPLVWKRARTTAVINQVETLSTVWDTAVERTLDISAGSLPALSNMLDRGEQHALLLSTLAGLSTSIGGAIAIVKKPGNDLLSFLLGVAIGVMATLSILEMWLHNAVEHGPIAITAATAAGVALYYAAQPYFPDFEQHQASSSRTLSQASLQLG